MGYAALFEISDRMLQNLRRAAGITSSVLEEKSVTRLVAA
jgi:hypothetical protein